LWGVERREKVGLKGEVLVVCPAMGREVVVWEGYRCKFRPYPSYISSQSMCVRLSSSLSS
jgi:hypothetical protein